MKKTLVLASLLAAFGAASAQSSVTLSGSTAFGIQKNYAAVKGITETDFSIVVSGREALGNGLVASFSAEIDNGTSKDEFRSAVTRKSTSIGLSGGFGAVTLANTRGSETAAMAFVGKVNNPDGFYDQGIFGRAAIDLIGYRYTAGAFSAGISHSESGNTAAVVAANFQPLTGAIANSGNVNAAAKTNTLSAAYNAGPLSVAAAYKMTSWTGISAPFNKNNVELAATYNLGFAKVGLGFDGKPAGIAAPANNKAAVAFGVDVPFGAASIGLNYAKRGTVKYTEFGAQYNLSPRTNVNISTGTKDVAGVSSKQNRVSVNHAF